MADFEDLSTLPSSFVPTLSIVAATTILVLLLRASRNGSNSEVIPLAPGGGVPLLGHALAYRRDPAGFLLAARRAVGDAFHLNLLGKRMVVLCGPKYQRRVASAPESVMSARDAVAAVGFEEMLGEGNVRRGTDLHKGIVKGLWGSEESGRAVVSGFVGAIRKALREETSRVQPGRVEQEVEFMWLVRRAMLRAVLDQFVGSFFLNGWEEIDFVGKFMRFQDDLEDATAKSAVMPRWLALPLLLRPLEKRRQGIERIIAARLRHAAGKPGELKPGFWLEITRGSYGIDEIAHFIVGLLFAGHKNPAIGAAQSYLMLQELASPDRREACVAESRPLLSDPTPCRLQESCPTLNRLCQESLRMTAHSIGGLRTAREDFVLGDGVVIPRGSSIALAHIPYLAAWIRTCGTIRKHWTWM
ncbi:hypothetical protein ACHAWF_011754 [Thalassiosira exigua]